MKMQQPMVEFKNVIKKYDDNQILKGIDMALKR